MQTTRAAAMIKSRVWSDESKSERRAGFEFRSLYVCSDNRESKIRC